MIQYLNFKERQDLTLQFPHSDLPHANCDPDCTWLFPICPPFPPEQFSALLCPTLGPGRLVPEDPSNGLLCLLASTWVQPTGSTCWKPQSGRRERYFFPHSLSSRHLCPGSGFFLHGHCPEAPHPHLLAFSELPSRFRPGGAITRPWVPHILLLIP